MTESLFQRELFWGCNIRYHCGVYRHGTTRTVEAIYRLHPRCMHFQSWSILSFRSFLRIHILPRIFSGSSLHKLPAVRTSMEIIFGPCSNSMVKNGSFLLSLVRQHNKRPGLKVWKTGRSLLDVLEINKYNAYSR